MNRDLVKRENASGLVLIMMMWAVSSVILTRIYLKLFNNPMIVFGHWHIAHVLWGGLLMIIAMVTVLAFEGNKIKKVGAAVFGVGWGLFIDEIGKYLSKDNNYWFQPAVIFIYISFIIIFLVYRYLDRTSIKSDKAIFYSVLTKLEEVANDDLEKSEKDYLIRKLKLIVNSKDKNISGVAKSLMVTVKKLEVKDNKKTGWNLTKFFNVSFNKILKRRIVLLVLWAYSIYFSIDKISDILRILASKQKLLMVQKYYLAYNFLGRSDIYMLTLKMAFDFIAASLFLIGASYFWSKKRVSGLRFFKYGLYVSILLVILNQYRMEKR